MSDYDTATAIGRNSESDTSQPFDTSEPFETTQPFTPDDAWVDEFEKQLTPSMIDRLRNYARPRALSVAYAGRKVDSYYARELVQDAIGDTWAGILRWDPASCALELHLRRAIKSRSSKHRKFAIENPHDAIGDHNGASRAAERDASSQVAEPEYAARCVFAHETMAQIRAAAELDKPVLRLLDAYDAGAQTKDDVLAFTKMKARTYHNAHIRLKRIVRNLTDATLAPKARA